MMKDCCDHSSILVGLCASDGILATSNASDDGFDPNDLINGSDRIWQSASGGAIITVGFPAPETPVTLNAIGISGLCAPVGTRVILFAGSSQRVADFILDEDCDDCTCRTIYRCFDEVSVASITYRFITPNNEKVTVCALLQGLKLPVEVLDGWSINVVDPMANPRRSLAGTRKTSCGPKWRELSVRLSMSQDAKTELLRQEMCKGSGLQMLLSIDKDSDDCDPTRFYATPKNLSRFTRQARFGRFSKPLVLEEFLCC